MNRPIDPMRRSLPLNEWPEQDRRAFLAAVAKGDVFDGQLNFSTDQVFHSYGRNSFEVDSIKSPLHDNFAFYPLVYDWEIKLARTIR